jgi:probable phosphoglycerate mutase
VIGPLANCAWSELVFQGTRWRLLRHNSAALDGVEGGPGVHGLRGGRGGSAVDGSPATAGDADAVG